MTSCAKSQVMTNGAPVTFRTAVPGDAESLVQLLIGGTLSRDAEDGCDVAPYERALRALAETGTGEVVVAVRDGSVVAMAQLLYLQHFQHRGGLCAEVESVHVRSDLRGQGIGTLLMDEVLQRADDRGAYRVQLTSNVARTDAHRFYERLGFQPTHVGYKRLR
jgi:GNAT superfamily N-acetyltransferase